MKLVIPGLACVLFAASNVIAAVEPVEPLSKSMELPVVAPADRVEPTDENFERDTDGKINGNADPIALTPPPSEPLFPSATRPAPTPSALRRTTGNATTAIAPPEFLRPTPRNFLDRTRRFALESESPPSISQPLALLPAQPIAMPIAQADPPVRVSDLTDVQPGDWAYWALQRLVQTYGCIEGDLAGRFDGQRSLTRYEFAAGLANCAKVWEEAQITQELPDPGQLEELRLLQQEFATELAALRDSIDSLETRLDTVRSQQFSTTAVMGGEAIFSVVGADGGDPPGSGEANATFAYLSRLGIVSSFTGRDRLRLELLAGNFADRGLANPERFNTDMALLSFQSDTDSDVILSKLEYRTAIGDRLVATFRPVGFTLSAVLTANSPYFDAGRGSLSRFGEANPIFKLGALDAGLGIDWLVADNLRLQLAYGASDAADTNEGLFDTENSAIGVQLLLKPSPTVLAGLSYVNAYSDSGRLNTFTGSVRADTTSFLNEPTTTHAIGTTLQWRVARDLTLGAWGSLMFTEALNSDARATTSTYLVSLGYSDPFGRNGDLLALLVGQPLRIVDGEDLPFGDDPDGGLHVELFYRARLTDRISLTPGVIWLHNPEHDADNNDIWIWALRSTFRF